MNETTAQAAPDRRPEIVLCAWDAQDDGWDPVEDLSGEPWSPDGARTIAIPAADPHELGAILAERIGHQRVRGMLLIGRSRHGRTFQLQMRAENRDLNGGGRLDASGPGIARSTAPVADIVRTLTDAGFAADATSDAEEDVGSYLLYRVLASLPENADTPAIGLLRAPIDQDGPTVTRAVKMAAQTMARHLSPLPRAFA